MRTLGLPVPPAFVVVADARAKVVGDSLRSRMRDMINGLERATGRTFGAGEGKFRLVVRCDPLTGPVPAPPVFGVDSEDALAEAVAAQWRTTEAPLALVAQAEVDGARDERSGSGVVFTRDPVTGSPGGYGRYATGRRGDHWAAWEATGEPLHSLRNVAPDAYEVLEAALVVIETSLSDMAEVAFTVQSGELWFLQARPGRRDAAAEVRIAVDLVDEGLITVDQALERVTVTGLARLQAPVLAAGQDLDIVARGESAAPGVAAGEVVFADDGVPTPEHAVVVSHSAAERNGTARAIVAGSGGGLNRLVDGPPAVVVPGLRIDGDRAHTPAGRTIAAGDHVTVDGGAGLVVGGVPRLVAAQLDHTLARFLDWCGEDCVEITAAARPGETLVDLAAPATANDLSAAVHDAVAAGATRIALGLPARVALEPRPSLGPWTSVVAGPEVQWAAALLAARLARRLDFPSEKDAA
jgi:pyruvate,orthophosphate dikinase